MSNPSVERRSYRKVFKRLWGNDRFLALTDSERVMALYVLAGPQTNRIGLFKFSIAAAAEDLARPENTVRRVFQSVVKAFEWEWHVASRVLWIPSWWKYNTPPKQKTNWVGTLTDLNDVPSTPLKSKFCNHLAFVPEEHRASLREWDDEQSPSTAQGTATSTAPSSATSTARATETKTGTETGTAVSTAQSSAPPLIANRFASNTTPIISRRPLDAVWEGPRGLYVLRKQHASFMQNRNGNEAELIAFYDGVGRDFAEDGPRGSEDFEIDMFDFWRARYRERWPPVKAKPVDVGPKTISAAEHRYAKNYHQPTGTDA